MKTTLAILTLLSALMLVPSAQAQISITGTVADTNGTTYAGGTGRIVLNIPADATQQPTFNGSPVTGFPMTIPGLGSFAQFSVTLPPSNAIQVGSPSGSVTTYTFSFCSAGYTSPNTQYCFTMTPLELDFSQDISGQITAQAATLPLPVTSLLHLNNVWTGTNSFPVIRLTGGASYADITGSFSSVRSITLPDVSGVICLTVTCPGTAPGGSNGQPQYNNAGVFAGFTMAGDCTLVVPTITCTATGGVPFAPSATVDATNASNLSGGTVPVARLSAIPNTSLANSSVTVNTTSPLSGGGPVSLGGSLTLTCTNCGGTAISAYNNCAMSSNVTVTTTATTAVVTCAVTMPSAGCPCRAIIHWGVTVDINNNNHIDFWVGDGTNSFRGTPPGGQTSDETGATGSVTTSATYANNAVVTFTLNTAGAGSPNYTVKAAPSVGGGNSGMDVSVFTSN